MSFYVFLVMVVVHSAVITVVLLDSLRDENGRLLLAKQIIQLLQFLIQRRKVAPISKLTI